MEAPLSFNHFPKKRSEDSTSMPIGEKDLILSPLSQPPVKMGRSWLPLIGGGLILAIPCVLLILAATPLGANSNISFIASINQNSTLVLSLNTVGAGIGCLLIAKGITVANTKRKPEEVKNDAMETEPPEQNKIIGKKTVHKTELQMLTGNVAYAKTKAIVNAANSQLGHGSGVCGDILMNAGNEPIRECTTYKKNNNISTMPIGTSMITGSGELKKWGVEHIIHTVGPNCGIAEQALIKESLLKNAYKSAFELAKNHNTRSIAIPPISAGIYGYGGYGPNFKIENLHGAARIAFETTVEFIKEHPDAFDTVQFIFLEEADEPAGKRLYEAYIPAFEQIAESN